MKQWFSKLWRMLVIAYRRPMDESPQLFLEFWKNPDEFLEKRYRDGRIR